MDTKQTKMETKTRKGFDWRILASIMVVGFVGLGIYGGTMAYFSDTETSTGNTMAAGRLDLTVNWYNDPIPVPMVTLEDMKPCMTLNSSPITLRVSNNPGKLYKRIVYEEDVTPVCDTNGVTEPECTDQHGIWTEGDQGEWYCNWVRIDLSNGRCINLGGIWNSGGGTCTFKDENCLFCVTWFDLEVWVPGGIPVPSDADIYPICSTEHEVLTNCWEIIIPDGNVTVSQLFNQWIYLGEYGEGYPNGAEVTIRQSFHMRTDMDIPNSRQSDSCTFTEEFMVRQTNAEHPVDACRPSLLGCEPIPPGTID